MYFSFLSVSFRERTVCGCQNLLTGADLLSLPVLHLNFNKSHASVKFVLAFLALAKEATCSLRRTACRVVLRQSSGVSMAVETREQTENEVSGPAACCILSVAELACIVYSFYFYDKHLKWKHS